MNGDSIASSSVQDRALNQWFDENLIKNICIEGGFCIPCVYSWAVLTAILICLYYLTFLFRLTVEIENLVVSVSYC